MKDGNVFGCGRGCGREWEEQNTVNAGCVNHKTINILQNVHCGKR